MIGETPELTRALSIRAPISNEEERAQFQRRLSLTSLVIFLLAGGFWVVATISVAVVAPDRLSSMWTGPTQQVQLATTSIAFIFWTFTRRGQRSVPILELTDAISTIAIGTGWGVMSSFGPPASRP